MIIKKRKKNSFCEFISINILFRLKLNLLWRELSTKFFSFFPHHWVVFFSLSRLFAHHVCLLVCLMQAFGITEMKRIISNAQNKLEGIELSLEKFHVWKFIFVIGRKLFVLASYFSHHNLPFLFVEKSQTKCLCCDSLPGKASTFTLVWLWKLQLQIVFKKILISERFEGWIQISCTCAYALWVFYIRLKVNANKHQNSGFFSKEFFSNLQQNEIQNFLSFITGEKISTLAFTFSWKFWL